MELLALAAFDLLVWLAILCSAPFCLRERDFVSEVSGDFTLHNALPEGWSGW